MCGIIAHFHTGENKEPVNEGVIAQYEDQHARGKEGFGVVTINEKMEAKVARATEGTKFMWDLHMIPSRFMMVHHRFPTSTGNYMDQTHPIVVDNGSLAHIYLVVHNGVISNDDEKKKEHEDLGFIYTTEYKTTGNVHKFNDSETLAIEAARFIEGQVNKIDIQGSVAFVALQINRKTKKVERLYFARNSRSPLNMAKTRNKLYLSSQGKGNEVTVNTLYSCKLDAEMRLTRKAVSFAIEPAYTAPTSAYPRYPSYPPYHTALPPYQEGKSRQRKLGFELDDDDTEVIHHHSSYPGAAAFDDIDKEEYIAPGLKSLSSVDMSSEVSEIVDEAKEEITETLETYFTEIEFPTEYVDPSSYASEIMEIMKNAQEKIMDIALQDSLQKEAEKHEIQSA